MDNNTSHTQQSFPEKSTLSGLDDSFRTPGSPRTTRRLPSSKVRHRSLVHDAVISVVLSTQGLFAEWEIPNNAHRSPALEVQANMIISIWTMENERYYNCTFTSATTTPLSPMRTHARALSGTPSQFGVHSSTQSSSSSPISPAPSPAFTSPNGVPLSVSPFPPLAPPPKTHTANASLDLHKLGRMKDAIIDAMEVPVMVMWHDESLLVQNKATTRLLHQSPYPALEDPLQMLYHYKCFSENFERQLQPEEYPLVELVRTRKPFSKRKIGLEDPRLGRRHFDCSGEAILDESTGHFVAGMVVMADVSFLDFFLDLQGCSMEYYSKYISRHGVTTLEENS